MVSLNAVRASNALINDTNAAQVSVFLGGTSGVGKLTIKALVSTGASLRIYLVGRQSSKERTLSFVAELHSINPCAEIHWIEGEVSLLSETARICTIIKGRESHIDLLFLTTGYAPFGARKETSEGIEESQCLVYYTRILFQQLLLPLLNAAKAKAPRVISVLSGGMEWSRLDLSDLDLKNPGNFTTVKALIHHGAMTTTTMEKLSTENPNVTFIHSSPGWVDTGNVKRGLDPKRPNAFMAWFVWLVLEPLIGVLAISDEVSGQRFLFQCVSAKFGGRGVNWEGKMGINTARKMEENGLFLVSSSCECVLNGKAVRSLRENVQERVWEHTQAILGPYL